MNRVRRALITRIKYTGTTCSICFQHFTSFQFLLFHYAQSNSRRAAARFYNNVKSHFNRTSPIQVTCVFRAATGPSRCDTNFSEEKRDATAARYVSTDSINRVARRIYENSTGYTRDLARARINLVHIIRKMPTSCTVIK